MADPWLTHAWCINTNRLPFLEFNPLHPHCISMGTALHCVITCAHLQRVTRQALQALKHIEEA